jgi:hypothetical protein
MNYELKSVSPGTVFLNAIRIFLVVGFIVGINYFFILRNPNVMLAAWWQKVMATLLFTVVYGLVVSVILTLISWLYNLWAGKYKGISIHLEQQ